MQTSKTPIPESDINSTVLLFGELIGLLKDEGSNQFSLNESWFNNPLTYINDIPSNPKLFELLEVLMSSANGTALGTPQSNLNKTWYPIQNPKTTSEPKDGKPLGVYFVSSEPNEDQGTILGFGLLHDFNIDSSVSIKPYGYFPLLQLPKNSSGKTTFVLGDDGHPVQLGINIDGKGVFQSGEGLNSISFDGINIGADIYFKEGMLPSLNLEFVNLKLPGEAKGSNRSIFDLINNTSVEEWVVVALSVVVTQLSNINNQTASQAAKNIVNSLMAILGLIGDLPQLDWEELTSKPTNAFVDWFRAIGGSNANLKEWINYWYCIFQNEDPFTSKPDTNVKGEGTLDNPFAINILEIKVSDSLSINIDFTTSTLTDKSGNLNFYPGFSVSTTAQKPLSDQDFGISVKADVFFLDFLLPPDNNTPEITFFPAFDLMTVASSSTTGDPLFSTTIQDNNFSVGTLQVGFDYQRGDGSVPTPTFKITDVVSGQGSWPVIDMTNLDLETVVELIEPIVTGALDKMFPSKSDNQNVTNAAAVLGLVAPPSFSGVWPLKDELLLDSSTIQILLNNPFSAIGAYYERCLSTQSDGKNLWEYLLPSWVQILGGAGTSTTGSGTEEDPWEIDVLNISGATINLSSWKADTNDLSLGFSFNVPITISGVTATIKLGTALLKARLPNTDGSGDFGANWLQSCTAQLKIDPSSGDSISSTLGGVTFQIKDLLFEAGWNQTDHFFTSGALEDVVLKATGVENITLGTLQLSSVSWSEQQLTNFAPAIVNSIGLLMIEQGGRVGLGLATLLGMIPGLPNMFNGTQTQSSFPFAIPVGFKLPGQWPQLSLDHPENPWIDIQNQIGSLLAGKGATMEPAMQLIGWSITGTLPKAPTNSPTGDLYDPWYVSLPDVADIDFLVYLGANNQMGYGIRRSFDQTAFQTVQINSVIRMDLPGLTLSPTQLYTADSSIPVAPRVWISTNFSNANSDKPLVEESNTGLTIGSVNLGAIAEIIDSNFDYGLRFAFLESRVTSKDQLGTIDLTQVPNLPQYTCDAGMDVIEALANAWMVKLTSSINEAAGQFPQLNAFLDILYLLEVFKKSVNGNKTEYGINIGAWDTILANPGSYFVRKTQAIVENGDTNKEFFNDLATLLGYPNFNLPTSVDGVQYLLEALGLLTPYPNNFYGLEVEAWVSLIKAPVKFFQQSIPALFNNPDALKLLVSQLKGWGNPPSDVFSVDASGYVITLQTPATPIKIGSELILFGSLQVNLKTLSMLLEVGAGAEITDTAIAFQFNPTYSNGQLSSNYEFVLEGLPNSDLPQPFPALALYPFPSGSDKTTYLQQLGLQIPISILSAFLSNVLNNYVAPKHPTVLNIFGVLGLTRKDETTETEQIKPLTGIFMHPIDWMFSAEVLGDGTGHLDLDKLGTLLYNLTDAAGIGTSVKLEPYEENGKKDGTKLTGLPYGTSFTFTSNTEVGATLSLQFCPELNAKLAPIVNLTAGLSFGLGKGFDINGDISMQFNLGPDSAPSANYIRIESLYAKEAFQLTVDGQYQNQAFYKPIKLIPFGGLSQFIDGTNPQNLLNFVGDQLFIAFNNYASIPAHADNDLVKFIQSIQCLSGIKSGTDLFNFFSNIKANPLTPFSDSNIENTIASINQLVTGIFKLNGFSIGASLKMLQYEHSIPGNSSNKIVLSVGNQSFNGQDEVFGLWIQPLVNMEWFVLSLSNTGVGVTLNGETLEYNVEIDLGLDLTNAPIAGLPNPMLAMAFNGANGQFNGPTINLYPIQKSTEDGTLEINLLPDPGLAIIGQATVTTDEWLGQFAVQYLVPFVVDLALSVKSVNSFLNESTIGSTTIVPGQILTDWGLLNQNETTKVYSLTNLQTWYKDNNGAEGIVTKLIFTALSTLNKQIIFESTNPNAKITVANDTTNKLFGLNLQMQDIVVTSGGDGKSTKLIFQLGKWYANQSSGDNWINNTTEDPGMIFYFIKELEEGSYQFNPKIELLSIGFDFDGPNEKTPLVDIKGVTINSFEPRLYLAMEFVNGGNSTINFGTSIFVNGIGIPLGPGFDQQGGNNTNPVAQNLLASGETTNGNTSAINPAFSFSTNYVSDATNDKFKFLLYDGQGNPTEKVWIPIMRSFGPLQARKIGFGWVSASKLLELLFDGSVALMGLKVDLQDLEIGIPVTDPSNFDAYSLDLAGMDVTFQGGPVTINGGFLKVGSGDSIQYVGAALLKAATFSLGAFGAYGLVNNNPSLFIFAYLDTPLGGPPSFFINGLSGGFGFNRAVVLPQDTADIASYPMVAGISDPSTLGGENGAAPSGTQVLEKLGTEYFPPKLGSYWVAAGIKFTTYEIVQSNAVVILQFGQQFEIDLIGVSAIVLPKKSDSGGLTYVNAELAFKVVFNPTIGVFIAEAVLTPNSWIIVPECKLTGGFAFYAWFKDQADSDAKAGDFVLTLGGYYPGWTPPDFYPQMSRLGINWHFSDTINLTGGAYFALTPSCVMAGASLSIVYQSGGLKAWLTAYANFLLSWKPFHYQISIGVSVGAKYSFFKVELGCNLELWGPQMAGVVKVNWFIISFSVKFGDQSTPKSIVAIIPWSGEEGFTGYFLPADQAPAPPPSDGNDSLLIGNNRSLADTPQKVQQVTKLIANNGLNKETTDQDGIKLWAVNAHDFVFEVQTVVPINQVTYENSTKEKAPLTNETPFGVKPVGTVTFTPGGTDKVSSMNIDFYYEGSPRDANEWVYTEATGSVSASLWGTVNDGKNAPGNELVDGVMKGVSSIGPDLTQKGPHGGLPTLEMDVLGRTTIVDRLLPLYSRPQLQPSGPVVIDDQSLSIVSSTIMEDDIVSYRNDIINSIVGLGISVNFDGTLDQIAAFATTTFQSPPLLGELGSIGEIAADNQIAAASIKVNLLPKVEESFEKGKITTPLLKSIIHQYCIRRSTAKGAFARIGSFIGGRPVFSGITHYRVHIGRNALGQALFKSVNEDSNSKSLGMQVQSGQSFLLEIPENKKTAIEIVGRDQLKVRVAAFDKHNQVVGEVTTESGQIELPIGTSHMVVSGLIKREDEALHAIGWHCHSSLLLANANTLLAEEALVIPNHPIRIRNKKYNEGNGLISGSEMVNQNWVELGSGQISRANIKTTFKTLIQSIAFIVDSDKKEKKSSNVSKSVRLKVPVYTDSNRINWNYQELSPIGKATMDEEVVLFYQLPGNIVNDQLNVISGTANGWYQKGVLGFKLNANVIYDNWQDIIVKNSLPQTESELIGSSQLLVKSFD